VQLVRIVISGFQPADHLAHFLALRFIGNQQGIGCVDDEQVIEADCGNQAILALNMRVAAVYDNCFSAACL
jgi:hypothetical protein